MKIIFNTHKKANKPKQIMNNQNQIQDSDSEEKNNNDPVDDNSNIVINISSEFDNDPANVLDINISDIESENDTYKYDKYFD